MNLSRARRRNWNLMTTGLTGLFLFSAVMSGFGNAGPGTTPVSVQVQPYFNYGSVSPNYNGQSLTNGKAYTMTAKARGNFTFTGWSYTDDNGEHTNSKAKLTFTNGLTFTAYFADRVRPALKINNPPRNLGLTNPAVTVNGTAKDNDSVTAVYCNLNDAGWVIASSGNNWTNWWVDLTLQPYTNVLLAYAVDRSGNVSWTNKLKMTYVVSAASLSNLTMTVRTNQEDTLFSASFGERDFSDGTGVGTYSYARGGPINGKVTLRYTAPPRAAAGQKIDLRLQFDDAENGTFTDDEGLNYFNLAVADTLAPPVLTGANLLLSSTNGSNQVFLNFLNPPVVVTNSGQTKLANPLVIALDGQYPGNDGDRVEVTFDHVQQDSSGNTFTGTPTYPGTVIDIGSDTVTVLFDRAPFLAAYTHYNVATGVPLNILTYYYTNYVGNDPGASGTGTFDYTNYGPVGALLQTSVSNATSYYVMTFTAASGDVGTYYVENYGGDGGFLGADSGSFGVQIPPVISTQPRDATVTNGATATFSIVATGSRPLTYQWQFNGGNLGDGTTGSGSTVTGSTTPTLTIGNCSTNDVGQYQVIVNNAYGTATSLPASLSVSLLPIITANPTNVEVLNTNNQVARFSVTATGLPPLSYQWMFNATNTLTDGTPPWSTSIIIGSTTANLNISSVTNGDLGNYTVIVSNPYGSVTSAPPATLRYKP